MKTQDSFLVFFLDFCTEIAYIIFTNNKKINMTPDYTLPCDHQDDPCDDVTAWLVPMRDMRKAKEAAEAKNNE